MKILFLHEVDYLEKPVFEMHEFPEYAAELGHQVSFLDFREHAPVLFGANFCHEVVSGRVVKGASIDLYHQHPRFSGTFGRIIGALEFPRIFKEVLREFRPEIVVSYAVPTSGWQASMICRARGIPFLYRQIDVSHKIRRTIFEPLIKVASRVVCRNAKWISSNNLELSLKGNLLGGSAVASSVEMPPIDVDFYQSRASDRISIRSTLGYGKSDIVLIYLGSLFYFVELDKVIRGLALTRDNIKLLVVGDGENRQALETLVKELNLQNRVKFEGLVPFGVVPLYLSIGDVGLNPMTPSEVSHLALPNKVLQYLAAGLPVVSTNLLGLRSALQEAAKDVSFTSAESHVSTALRIIRENPTRSVSPSFLSSFGRESAVNIFLKRVEMVAQFV